MVLIYDMNTGNVYEPESAKPLPGDPTNPLEPQFSPTPRLHEAESTAPVDEHQHLPVLGCMDIDRLLASMEFKQK